MGIETLLSAGLGAAGLLQNRDQGNAQRDAQSDANALGWEGLNWQKDMFSRFNEPALMKLFGIAQNYDPAKEAQASTDYASTVAQDAIGRALRGFNVSQAAGGATPGNSSLEGAQRAAVMKPIGQQLAGIVADAQGNSSAKRAGMWQAVLGQAPAGNLAQSYFQQADRMAQMANSMPGANYGPSSQLLSQAIGGLLTPRAGGAGGRGDRQGTPSVTNPFSDTSTDTDNQARAWWQN